MHYYSINDPSLQVGFREAMTLGQAPDKGLFFPSAIPFYSAADLHEMKGLAKEELAFRIMKPYVNGEIPDDALRQITADTVNFPIPLKQVTGDISALELFHGPTLAFKDVGARFMSRCLAWFQKKE